MLRRIEAITDDATQLGLAVAIANNPSAELLADPESQLGATLAHARQLAAVLTGRGGDVIVEPLTEPRQALDPIWNRAAAELIGAIRFLAEFGTSSNADIASRARWTRFNRQLAESHGMPWGIWALAPIFAIHDLEPAPSSQTSWRHSWTSGRAGPAGPAQGTSAPVSRIAGEQPGDQITQPS